MPPNSLIISKSSEPGGLNLGSLSPGVPMNEPEILTDPRAALDLGRVLGQRRAFVALGGRCSAAHAELLRRVRDEKLYLAIAPSWPAFCGSHLTISRPHADSLIAPLTPSAP